MNKGRLLRAFLLYAGLFGAVSAGLVLLLFQSGLALLVSAAVGIFLVVLGGGTAGSLPASGSEAAVEAGMNLAVEDMGLWPGRSSGLPVQLALLFYGIGLLGWSGFLLAMII